MSVLVQGVAALLIGCSALAQAPTMPHAVSVATPAALQTPPAAAAAAAASASALQPSTSSSQDLTIEAIMGMRDPFRITDTQSAPVVEADIPELLRFNVDEYKLVGIVTGTRKNKALISAPGGKMHIIAEGDALGLRKGTIKRIEPGKVLVEEKVINILGREETEETSLVFEEKK